VVYFHENQLTYPLSPSALPDLSYGMRNWLSMAAADEVWFNSAFHQAELARALPVLLGSMPDHRHTSLVDGVLDRSRVMPVGITVSAGSRTGANDADAESPIVLWNQRWEYDKDPARFFGAIDRASDRGISFRLAVAGQNFRSRPAEFAAARTRHADRLVHFGEADPATYRDLLVASHVVVSTARHEFFGIAVAEAVAAGCSPVLPNALAYPELVGEAFAHLLYDDDDGLDERLDRAIGDRARGSGPDQVLCQSVASRYAWSTVASRYDRRLSELISC
jgi:glycosyltransferase involved in cell wall biosynthesis